MNLSVDAVGALPLDDRLSPAPAEQGQTNKLSIQRCIRTLVHAYQCKDETCQVGTCRKMKRVVLHVKRCKIKTNGGCEICKRLIALGYYHAKHCQETKCQVPFCRNIKSKLIQQSLQQRLQRVQLLGRPIAVTNTLPTGPPSTSTIAILQQAPQQLMQQPGQQVQPGMGMGEQMPRRAGVIGGPVGIVPRNQVQEPGPADEQAIQQLMATLRSPSTPEQQRQINQIFENNPRLMAAFTKDRRPSGQHGNGVGPLRRNEPQQ